MAQSNPKDLDKTDIEKINNYRSKIDQIIYSLGELYLNEIQLESRKENLKDELDSLTDEEDELLDKLSEKYGEGQIDLSEQKFYPSTSSGNKSDK